MLLFNWKFFHFFRKICACISGLHGSSNNSHNTPIVYIHVGTNQLILPHMNAEKSKKKVKARDVRTCTYQGRLVVAVEAEGVDLEVEQKTAAATPEIHKRIKRVPTTHTPCH